ncbi:MAG: ribosome hibernation-promoting factor, HPF/YfiA family [Amnibacterium sp.]
MDITLIGRNVGITEQFRTYAEEKADRVANLADRALALEIRLCRHHETNGTAGDDRVEMTLIGPGPVVRAEAGGADKFAAFDAALAKLMERIRRAKDRKKVHRGHGDRMTSLRKASADGFASAGVVPADGDSMIWAETGPEQPETLPTDEEPGDEYGPEQPESPVVIRRKSFPPEPITIDDALYRMELVGHDFYLFIDKETNAPSVVYRRIGWSYGVIALDGEATGEPADTGASIGEDDRELQEAAAG